MLVVLPAGVSTASAASDDADMLTVTMTRTDALGDEVYVGDTLTYSFTNTNNTSSAFTAFPRRVESERCADHRNAELPL